MNLLLDQLAILTEDDIKKLTNRTYLSRGRTYAREEKVKSWSWANNRFLVAIVQGSVKYTVIIKRLDLLKKHIEASCSCPEFERYSDCKHISCVLLTVVYTMAKQYGYNKKLYANLVDNLADSEMPKATLFTLAYFEEIVLIPCFDKDDLAEFSDLDQELQALVDKIGNSRSDNASQKAFTQLFAKAIEKQSYTILTEYGDLKPTKICTDFFVKPKVLFESTEQGTVEVSRLIELPESRYLRKFILISESGHILDVETLTIYVMALSDFGFWSEFEKIGLIKPLKYSYQDEYLKDSSGEMIYKRTLSQNMPLFFFQSAPSSRLNLENFIVFKAFQEEEIRTLESKEIQANLHITTSGEGLFAVSSAFVLNNELVHLPNPLDDLFKYMEKSLKEFGVSTRVYRPLSQRVLLYTLWHKPTPVESKKFIKEAIEEINQSKVRINKKEALQFLNNLIEHISMKLQENYCAIVISQDGSLCQVTMPSRQVLMAYAVAYKYYPDFKQISLSSLNKNIRALAKDLNKNAIALFINLKKVRISKATISVQVKRNDIDWFEVKPEISINKDLLDEKDLLELMHNNKRETENLIEFLDEDSDKILEKLKKHIDPQNGQESEEESGQIVMTRPLKIFEILSLYVLNISLKLPEKEKELIESLSRFKNLSPEVLPKNLKTVLRPYQHEGYSWLAFLYKHQFGACLADDMGLGKTVQAIAFLGAIYEDIVKNDNKKKPHLVVVPPSLLFNWQQEFLSWYPDLKIQEYSGAKRTDIPLDCDVVLTTYDTVRIDIKKFEQVHFNVIIFDEAQIIKNLTAKRTGAVRQLQSVFKLCLTGTPLENNIQEFYSIMDLAVPSLLPEYNEFKSWNDEDQISYSLERTRPFILRRKKDVIAHELPEKMEQNIYLNMSDGQKAFYQTVVKEIKNTIDVAYKDKTHAQASIIALTALLRLRQICVSTQLIVPAKKDSSPKLDYLIEKLKELAQEKNAALVFSQFTACLDIIETRLKKEKIEFLRIDGSTPINKRKEIVAQFQEKNSKCTVLLLSLKTGGVGLNLVRANYVFHVDPWWNPAVENQASDRAYRIGQKQKVIVCRLLMYHSIEEKMMKLKQEKMELFEAICDGTQTYRKVALSKKDFDFLLN